MDEKESKEEVSANFKNWNPVTEKESPRKKSSLMQKEVQIKLNPGKILKFFLVFFALIIVFYGGRISVSGFEIGILGSATTDIEEIEDVADKVEELTEEETVEETESDNALTGAIVAEEEEEEVEEEIITTYARVALSLDDVKVDWKETWGKITQLSYTIKNNEEGTIKPNYFVMMVEGYDDQEKRVPLPVSSLSIPAGKSLSSKVTVPKGFAYSRVTAGKLDSVGITLLLYDANAKLITSYSNVYDLQE